jgi:hypothetical protein
MDPTNLILGYCYLMILFYLVFMFLALLETCGYKVIS